MKTIRCSTSVVRLNIGDLPLWRFYVRHNGTIYFDTFCRKVAQKCGLPEAMVKAVITLVVEQFKEELQNGCRVELPELSVFLTVPGSVRTNSTEAWKAANLKPVVRMVAKGALKTCCQGPEFTVVNVTTGAKVTIRYVSDMVSRVEDAVTNGINVEVHVVGMGLLMPDVSDGLAGMWLAAADGTVLARAVVGSSTETSLVGTFPQIDISSESAYLCVGSYAGLDPEQYGMTVAKKKVAVINASGGEAEGV